MNKINAIALTLLREGYAVELIDTVTVYAYPQGGSKYSLDGSMGLTKDNIEEYLTHTFKSYLLDFKNVRISVLNLMEGEYIVVVTMGR